MLEAPTPDSVFVPKGRAVAKLHRCDVCLCVWCAGLYLKKVLGYQADTASQLVSPQSQAKMQ
jgi:hypothetical protein